MKIWQTLTVRALVCVLAFTVFEGVLSAHHGRSGYANEEVALSGVVTEVRWRNPHVIIFFDVKDDAGVTVQWSGELSSVNTMIAAGLGRNTMRPGDEIAITGRAAELGSPHSLLLSIVKADGTVVLEPSNEGGRFTQRTRESP